MPLVTFSPRGCSRNRSRVLRARATDRPRNPRIQRERTSRERKAARNHSTRPLFIRFRESAAKKSRKGRKGECNRSRNRSRNRKSRRARREKSLTSVVPASIYLRGEASDRMDARGCTARSRTGRARGKRRAIGALSSVATRRAAPTRRAVKRFTADIWANSWPRRKSTRTAEDKGDQPCRTAHKFLRLRGTPAGRKSEAPREEYRKEGGGWSSCSGKQKGNAGTTRPSTGNLSINSRAAGNNAATMSIMRAPIARHPR